MKTHTGPVLAGKLRRAIIAYTSLALAVVSFMVAAAAIGPLALRLRHNALDSYRHALALKVMASEQFLDHARELARQITSRVGINEKLEASEKGGVDARSLSDYTSPRLDYALRLSPEMKGIVRLDAQNRMVAAVGASFPWQAASLPTGRSAPAISTLYEPSGTAAFVVAATIFGRDGHRIGTDLVLMDMSAIRMITEGFGDTDHGGDMIVIGRDMRGETEAGRGGPLARVIVPYRHEPVPPPDSPEFRLAGLVQGTDEAVTESRAGYILVAQGVPGTGWAMIMRVSASEATADVDRFILLVSGGALLLSGLGVMGLLMVLRPLTGAFIIQAEDMRRQIEDLEQARFDLDAKSRRLGHSNAQLQEYAYAASHDLQEPLRTVTSFAQLLAKRYHGRLDAEGDEFIDFIVEGAHRMHGRLNDLLAYARLDGDASHGAADGGFQPVDMDAVVEGVVANLGAAIAESGAAVETSPLPKVLGRREQMDALLQNLIANAIKFAKPGCAPHVKISGRRDGGRVEIVVRDNGIGIAPEFQDQIFQMFKRLHPPGTYDGSGIGLAMCRRVVENHGGRIWVDSQAGAGAAFHVLLPAAEN